MALELLIASQVIGRSLGRWFGEAQVPSLVELAKRIDAARNAVSVAEQMLEDAKDITDANERKATIDAANQLVAIARATVTDGARKAAVAVPTEVLEGFEKWDDALVNVGTIIAEEAKSTIVTLFGIGIAGLVLYGLGRKLIG